MYPLKLSKIYKEKPWGGNGFSKLFSFSIADDKCFGESWEASVFPTALSQIDNGRYAGMTLSYLVTLHPEILSAKECARGDGFPLLIKFLDINDRLSIQVHPDDRYAKIYENSIGKTESWYILKASPNAKIISGMNEGVNPELFAHNAEINKFEDMFRTTDVQKGDFLTIEPGMVHGTVEGSIVLYEIQQNSDITYRIYDYGRRDDKGNLRELHTTKAADVITFDKTIEISHAHSRSFESLQGGKRCVLTNNNHFCLTESYVNGSMLFAANDSFLVLSATEGKGKITHNSIDYDLRAGDTWLIPAGLSITVSGITHLLSASQHT